MNNSPESERPLVALDAVPEPAARYALREGAAVFDATNDAFAAAFGDVTPGTAVAEWCREVGLTAPDGASEDLAAAIDAGETVDGEQVWIDDGSQAAHLQATPPVDDDHDHDRDHGVLVLTGPGPEGVGGVNVDRIASVVSHDLRNPLDIALAHLNAAREEVTDPTVSEHVDAVLDAHDRMEHIIEDVLTLARGEGAIDPRDAVRVDSVAEDAWQTVETEGATLALDDDLPTVEADPDRLRRLMENLFRNSVEHGSTGSQPAVGDSVEHGSTGSRQVAGDRVEHDSTDGPTTGDDSSSTDDRGSAEDTDAVGAAVRVRVGRRNDGPGFVVADDGPGIPPEERERVFVPGYSSTDCGTGLGLTIVERIARAHGWSVALGRSEADGTRVEFRLDGDEDAPAHVVGGSEDADTDSTAGVDADRRSVD